MSNTTLYWFNNDLRLNNNPSFTAACNSSDAMVCAVVLDPAWLANNRYGVKTMGSKRLRYWLECVADLSRQLNRCGQHLHCLYDDPVNALSNLAAHYQVDTIAYSEHVGWYEQRQQQAISKRYPKAAVTAINAHRIFDHQQLPFALPDLPATFSRFRKLVEPVLADCDLQPTTPPQQLPPVPDAPYFSKPRPFPRVDDYPANDMFVGGETAASHQLGDYFSGKHASHYTQVRNQLDGWYNSTKFSACLATGAASPRSILQTLRQYEAAHGGNESTYWIAFELLWREYFQWYALAHGGKLFRATGLKSNPTHTSFYPGRFQQWCQGTTAYPLVNACMKQLNQTGYMSNRGRQIVASCFVNELDLDWRYGAAYFEQQLLDYDVANNWGNWQYLAGVGCDPRGKRHFDINKQAHQYDPDGEFVARWQGNVNTLPLDAVDAADWPSRP